MNVSDFNNLLSLLPNYSGYCSSGSSRKMAFIYKSNLSVNNIYTIFSSQTYNFAGRDAPIVISLNHNGEDVEIINSHFKCCGDGILDTNDISDEENRRYRAMNMIKNYIDNNLQSSKVILLGDLNDELQDSFQIMSSEMCYLTQQTTILLIYIYPTLQVLIGLIQIGHLILIIY